MRNALLIILFALFFSSSYSQDLEEIKLDAKSQIKYSDTLINIGERLTGKWKYLGKRTNKRLIDTVGISFRDNKKTVIIVENGIVITSIGNKRRKADYFYEITYNFKNGKNSYSCEEKSLNGDITSITDCQPIPKLVYYKEKFGILFIGMLGENFEPIRKLNRNYLVLENGKEYIKIK